MGELSQILTVEEFIEWQVVYRMKPFGHYEDHLQMAMVGAVVASRLGKPAVKVEKLLITVRDTPEHESQVKKNAHVLMLFAARHNKAYEQRQAIRGHDR